MPSIASCADLTAGLATKLSSVTIGAGLSGNGTPGSPLVATGGSGGAPTPSATPPVAPTAGTQWLNTGATTTSGVPPQGLAVWDGAVWVWVGGPKPQTQLSLTPSQNIPLGVTGFGGNFAQYDTGVTSSGSTITGGGVGAASLATSYITIATSGMYQIDAMAAIHGIYPPDGAVVPPNSPVNSFATAFGIAYGAGPTEFVVAFEGAMYTQNSGPRHGLVLSATKYLAAGTVLKPVVYVGSGDRPLTSADLGASDFGANAITVTRLS